MKCQNFRTSLLSLFTKLIIIKLNKSKIKAVHYNMLILYYNINQSFMIYKKVLNSIVQQPERRLEFRGNNNI